jgi:ethylene receptor
MILHIVGNLLNSNNEGGTVMLQVFPDKGSQERHDHRWAMWRQSSSVEDVYIRFEIGIYNDSASQSDALMVHSGGSRYNSDGLHEQRLSFSICKKLAQMMQGNIWVIPNAQGLTQSMTLALRFQLRPSISISISESGESSEYPHSNSIFRGLHIILADHDDINRAVTRKLLEKLGCIVNAVSSGFECLAAVGAATSFQIILLDLQMPELDGFEVAARIRKFRSRCWPLIVALTASGDEDAWEKCKQVGMNGIIRKPVQLQGIASELRRVLVQANKV